MARWSASNTRASRKAMTDELAGMMAEGTLQEPDHEIVDLPVNDQDEMTRLAQKALHDSTQGFGGKKFIFRMV